MTNEIDKAKAEQIELDKSPAKSNPVGRPTIYTPELAATLCSQLALGRSLRSVCKDEGMPDISIIFDWFHKFPEFTEQYARAKEESADAMAEEILDIANNPELGEIVTVKSGDDDKEESGSTETKTIDMLGHRKLKIETRKWLMSKMKPKKYGDKLDLTSGDKPLAPAATTAEIVATVQEIINLSKNDKQNPDPSDPSPST